MASEKIEHGNDYGSYIVATAFFSLLAVVGFALYGLPFFYDFWEKDFGWTRGFITSGNAFSKIIAAPLFGFIAGWIIDRHGPRRMMLAGSVLAGAALVGLGLMSSVWMFYFFYFFNAVGYVFGGPLPCQVLVSKSFTGNRGKAMGIAYLGIGTGGVIVPHLSAALAKYAGWHFALCALGILIVVISFPLAFFVKDSRLLPGKQGNRNESMPLGKILSDRNFYLLAAGSMCSIAAVGGANQHLKLFLRDLNFSQSGAATVISVVLFSSLAGRVLMGWLADSIQRKYVMILIYILIAVSIPFLLVPDFPGRIYIFAVIFGIGLGGDYMIIPLMAADLFGIKALGRVMGIILVADGMAEAVSPMLVGTVYDHSGHSYTAGFMILVLIALAGIAAVSFLRKAGDEMSIS